MIKKSLSKYEEKWNYHIDKLDKYIQKNGIKNITKTKAPKEVFNFYRHRKEDFRKGTLTEAKIEDLKKIGVVFSMEGYNKAEAKKYSSKNLKPIEGLRFKNLTVIENSNSSTPGGSILYSCECDCGNKTLASRHELTGNKKVSCGLCEYSKRKYLLKDYIGKKIGMLTILDDKEEKINTKHYWTAQCECGNITKVSTSNLFSPNNLVNKHNCGCLNSKQNKKILDKAIKKQMELRENGILNNSLLNAKMKLKKSNKSGYIGVHITKESVLKNGTIQKSHCQAKIAFNKVTTLIGKYEPTNKGLLQGAIDRDIYIIENDLPHTRNFTDEQLLKNIHLTEAKEFNKIIKKSKEDLIIKIKNRI